jgi:hypothetical protein
MGKSFGQHSLLCSGNNRRRNHRLENPACIFDAMITATVYAHVTDQQAETASGRFANAFNA